MTDNAPPKQKHGGRKLNKKGELECDLFYIGRDDLPDALKKGVAKQYYALNVVDRLTSYCKIYFIGGSRPASKVKPFLVKAIKFFEDKLQVDKKQMHMYHDAPGHNSFEVVHRLAWVPAGEVLGAVAWATRHGNIIQLMLPPGY